MKTAAQLATALVTGTLDRTRTPELDDEEIAADVAARLEQVGLQLAGASGRWLARPAHAAEPDEAFDPTFHLNSPQLAMIAALYLHLRYLPRQAGAIDGAEVPSVEIEDLYRAFPGYRHVYIDRMILGSLVNAGFIRRNDGRVYAGPYLSALDEVEADARAQAALSDFQLRRYLLRRAAELETGNAPD